MRGTAGSSAEGPGGDSTTRVRVSVGPSALINFFEEVGLHMEQESETERKRILVTHNWPRVVEILQFNMERAGYETRTSSDGLETLEIARSWRPHVILTDVLKPGINGIEMIKRLKADDQTKRIPVVVVWARAGEPESRQIALKAGAFALVVIPMDMSEVLQTVADALKQWE